MFKRFFDTFALAALVTLLTACSSGVPLTQPPVADAGRSSSTGTGPGGSTTNVEPVRVDQTMESKDGPVGVARIIYFDFDSYTIKPEFQAQVDSHARYLRANSARRISIEGHTDERGGREYNLALGQKRSEAVRRALTLLGVSDAQVEAVSFGEEKPAAGSAGEEAWAKSRRAEIVYR